MDAFERIVLDAMGRQKRSMRGLSCAISVSKSAVSNWFEKPDVITLGNLRRLVGALDLTDKEILAIVKEAHQ